MTERRRYILTLDIAPDQPGQSVERKVARVLKMLLRVWGARCISAVEVSEEIPAHCVNREESPA